VLSSGGTLWLNLGDSYAGSGRGGNPTEETSGLQGGQASQRASMVKRTRPSDEIGLTSRRATRNLLTRFDEVAGNGDGRIHTSYVPAPAGLKQKDLMGMPWRVAFALQADGWYLRQDIIWSKPNPMPESVTDRCTKAHEYIFLLSKSERYYYDAIAIREPAIDTGRENGRDGREEDGRARPPNSRPRTLARLDYTQPRKIKIPSGWDRGPGAYQEVEVQGGRNKRSVWEIATSPFPEAHFATFPPALIEPCILAGCPKGGTVLDPFGGAGTTGLVTDRLGRDAILIELNPDYAAMAERRIRDDAPLFAEAAE
jgi:DNA methylase